MRPPLNLACAAAQMRRLTLKLDGCELPAERSNLGGVNPGGIIPAHASCVLHAGLTPRCWRQSCPKASMRRRCWRCRAGQQGGRRHGGHWRRHRRRLTRRRRHRTCRKAECGSGAGGTVLCSRAAAGLTGADASAASVCPCDARGGPAARPDCGSGAGGTMLGGPVAAGTVGADAGTAGVYPSDLGNDSPQGRRVCWRCRAGRHGGCRHGGRRRRPDDLAGLDDLRGLGDLNDPGELSGLDGLDGLDDPSPRRRRKRLPPRRSRRTCHKASVRQQCRRRHAGRHGDCCHGGRWRRCRKHPRTRSAWHPITSNGTCRKAGMR